MSQLHVRSWGEGSTVVLVHGSGSTGAIFEPLFQLPGYHFLAPDRRGYGDSPASDRVDFDVDALDIADLLGNGAHLVGQSYGGVVALLAAARRPGAVRSLAVSEPPAFRLAREHPAVDSLARNMEHLYGTMGHATPEEFDAAFDGALGIPPSAATPMDEQTRRNIRAMMTERLPTEATVPLARLAAAPFPKLVISGGWSEAFDAVCDVLVSQLAAERAVFPGTGHSIIAKGKPLVERLASFWRSAEHGDGGP